MTRAEIVDRIRQTVTDSFPDMEGMELREDTVINTDTAIDSMGLILIICRLEGEFGIQIPHRKWSRMQTVGDVADAIQRAMQK